MKRKSLKTRLGQRLAAAATRLDRSEEETALSLSEDGIVSRHNFVKMQDTVLITVNGAAEYCRAVVDGRVAGDPKEAAHYLDQLAIRTHWQEPASKREYALQAYAMVLADIIPGDKKAAAMAIRYIVLDEFTPEQLSPNEEPESES